MNVANLRKSRTQVYGRLAVMFSMIFMLGVAIADQADTDDNNFGRMLVAVPLLAAVFGKWPRVALISGVNLFLAFALGHFSSHGRNDHPMIYFAVMVSVSFVAIFVAWVRQAVDQRLQIAMEEAVRLRALEEMASTDWLTGKLNRRGVAQAIRDSEIRFKSIVMFDIDGLKFVNDTYGHRVGDKFIKHVTARLASSLKSTDVFGRWGGDEFVLLLPHETDLAHDIVERVIAECESSPLVIGDIKLNVRVSGGIARWKRDENFDQVLTRADGALYEAKHKGGCCVVVAKDQ